MAVSPFMFFARHNCVTPRAANPRKGKLRDADKLLFALASACGILRRTAAVTAF